MRIDAHCHTDCSDGNISIEQRIAFIRKVGFDAATITDHDFISTEQVARAEAAAGELPYIPGIELSLAHKGQVVHMLGYYVEPAFPPLQAHIQRVQEVDKALTAKLLADARSLGITFEIDDLISPSLHTFYSLQFVKRLAREVFDNDSARLMPVFLELMDNNSISYSDFSPWPVRDAIDLIRAAGGFAVLAHPGGREDPAMNALGFLFHSEADVHQYVEWGLDGIEISHPVHTGEEKAFYEGLAEKFSLLTTAGSDCHGDDPFLGPAEMGKFMDIPDDLYDRMLAYHLEMKANDHHDS